MSAPAAHHGTTTPHGQAHDRAVFVCPAFAERYRALVEQHEDDQLKPKQTLRLVLHRLDGPATVPGTSGDADSPTA